MLEYLGVDVEHNLLGQVGDVVARALEAQEHTFEVYAERHLVGVFLCVLGQDVGSRGVDFVEQVVFFKQAVGH